MKLHYQITGAGEPLIIVHGLFGSSDNWRSLAKTLSLSAQVITVDLRNHGRSPHDDMLNYDLMADDLAELLTELKVTKANFIGHSIGGKVVMAFSQRYPSYCKQLAIVDIAPREYEPEHTAIFDALLGLDLQAATKRSDVDTALSVSIKDKSVRQFLLMNIVSCDQGLAWRINLPALHGNYPQLLKSVCDNAGISIPTLFIRGGRSRYITDEDALVISKTFEDHQLYTVEQAGHWVHAEAPELFLNKVNEFFNYD